jgi:hypothetical protein
VPVWHEQTKELQDTGKIQMVGLIEEQHPDRCALFMQWKDMDWPIMADPLNLLGVRVVPIHVLIDEAGIVRFIRPSGEDLEAFIAAPPPDDIPEADAPSVDLNTITDTLDLRSHESVLHVADQTFMWGGDESLDTAVLLYERAATIEPDHGPTHFRLGVALRRRYESDRALGGDFEGAIRAWRRARDIDPNQYIWRRRIQQYGPRLDKPYSFYDWVLEARADIIERGDTPHPLPVEPGGAEYADRAREITTEGDGATEPDPEGRIDRDLDGLVRIKPVDVPSTAAGDRARRVHIRLSPTEQAHWNNEVEPLEVWIDPPAGWTADARRRTAPQGQGAVSSETRTVEFELEPPADAAGPLLVPGYALYYVCEDADGTCLYRRQDFVIEIRD